ncbi:MAG: RNA-binding transcriptional accessory protein, partial [Clostridia bacterium]|nr:RNA-binding transcriptional accessory protein [Clostridia bacterium]
DIYRPYRPKRKTRASVAKARGLEPLADQLYAQQPGDPAALAEPFVDPEKEVNTVEEALAGARDIIAERVSDDAAARKRLRVVCMANGKLTAKAAKEELGVYEMYADFAEPLCRIAGHRVLAVNRGEREEALKVAIDFDRVRAMTILQSIHVQNDTPCAEQVRMAMEDAYDRLLFPSLERELRNELTEKAADAAIKVFSVNLRQLLMQPPLKGRVVLGLDPGYRTGCKVAVVDGTGKVLDTGVIYAVPPHNKVEQAKAIIKGMVKCHGVQVFAIGNGTASHETEVFAAQVIRELDTGLSYMVVSEAGASVYSASKLAAEEFPDYDVSLRSAVSIARRLQDPLAELVKIDPKAIGVGQYQHDMPEKHLSEALDGVVEGCVNGVGVDLNTASAPLLARVAGVSNAVAKNIVAYRQENGAFTSRAQLKKVPKLGPKAFEQCAGFLRVPESKELLDHTAVHPESYDAAKQLLALCGLTEVELAAGGAAVLGKRVEQLGYAALAQKLGIGEPTLKDVVEELQKPGRDPRDELPPPLLRVDVMGMEDLKLGMELTGTVRNVIDFGAFVDIGVHQDGLVHVSQITNRYIKHPSEVLKVGDIVKVWVLSVDVPKKRIGLTMKQPKG